MTRKLRVDYGTPDWWAKEPWRRCKRDNEIRILTRYVGVALVILSVLIIVYAQTL